MWHKILVCAVLWLPYSSGVENVYKEKKHKLRRLSCGLWAAYNRGFPETWQEISRSLGRWVTLDTAQRKKPFETAVDTIGFSYIDTYNGQELSLDENESKNVYRVVARYITNHVDNKHTFQLAARRTGIEKDLVPRSYIRKDDALKNFEPEDVDVVFVKDPYATYGNGISVVALEDLEAFDVPSGHIMQEGLTRNLALYNGAKVTVRAYLIVMHGRLYVHRRGFVQLNNVPFDGRNTSKEVQVSHDDYTIYNLDMRLPHHSPEFVDDRVATQLFGQLFPIESIAGGTKWMDSLMDAAHRMGPLLQEIITETYEDPFQFSWMGIDLIPFQDGSLKLLEINTYPSFRRFDVMADLLLLALGMEKWDPDLNTTRLVEVWKVPEYDFASNEEL